MTQQEMPNPIDLYSAAIKGTRQIIGGVQSSQLGDSTPCSEWNVQALMDHLIGGTGMIWGSLAGAAPETPQGNSPGAAFDAGTAKPESTEGGRRVSVLKRQEGAPVLLG